jgi:hypothetical protein
MVGVLLVKEKDEIRRNGPIRSDCSALDFRETPRFLSGSGRRRAVPRIPLNKILAQNRLSE